MDCIKVPSENLRRFLFDKGYLVGRRLCEANLSGEDGANVMAVMTLLGKKYAIKILSGCKWATESLLEDAADFLGMPSALPFYRGFPKSVMELSPDQIILDQLYAYTLTYGFGWFEETTHSVLENQESFNRIAFAEKVTPREMKIVSIREAWDILGKQTREMLSGSRPLSPTNLGIVMETYRELGNTILPGDIPCKDTVVKLLYETRDLQGTDDWTRYLRLPDVIKLLSYISFSQYGNENLKKLNLRNQDRKLLSRVINALLKDRESFMPFEECCEKKQIWCGLLHHIHFGPETENAKVFADTIRSNYSRSDFSLFERMMNADKPVNAAAFLVTAKGPSAVLRNLNYILSRCESERDILSVLDVIAGSKNLNPVVLIQLYIKYMQDKGGIKATPNRNFVFTKNGRLVIHKETDEEKDRRRTNLPIMTISLVRASLLKMIYAALSKRVKGTVYIDPEMERRALPLSEAASNGGIGTLTAGSRIPIPEGKKIRAFTYWEKVDDVDLSCLALNEDGETLQEFSWRTMGRFHRRVHDKGSIVFSGDETSGYNGGSEYFDINIEKFEEVYPSCRYLVFCDNIFTSDQCFDTLPIYAGFMLRDEEDSGEIYEPKTVQSKYRLQGDSTFTYMYAIDLNTREMIWLSMNRKGSIHVAGETEMDFLGKWLDLTKIMSVGRLFMIMAENYTLYPEEADVIVSDREIEKHKDGAVIVRSTDSGKILSYLNPGK